jgi:hypothetical protein
MQAARPAQVTVGGCGGRGGSCALLCSADLQAISALRDGRARCSYHLLATGDAVCHGDAEHRGIVRDVLRRVDRVDDGAAGRFQLGLRSQVPSRVQYPRQPVAHHHHLIQQAPATALSGTRWSEAAYPQHAWGLSGVFASPGGSHVRRQPRRAFDRGRGVARGAADSQARQRVEVRAHHTADPRPAHLRCRGYMAVHAAA